MPYDPIARWSLSLLMAAAMCSASAQAVPPDSTYLRMPDRSKAMEAMRFDMSTYRDTLRLFRDALETTATGVDAIAAQGQDRKALLGRLRDDVKALDKELKRQGKQLKKSAPPFEQCARDCSVLVRRVKMLRAQLVTEGVRLSQ